LSDITAIDTPDARIANRTAFLFSGERAIDSRIRKIGYGRCTAPCSMLGVRQLHLFASTADKGTIIRMA
jgi:hypothetical protein